MGKRFRGSVLVVVSALVMGISVGQIRLMAQQRGPQPATAAPQRGAQPAPATQRGAQPAARPARMAGHPNFNGIWQAMNTANWNLEAHSVQGLPEFWQLGAIAGIPAGKSVLKGGGTIPYRPEALKKRDENRARWPAADNEAKCYMLGIPRATYHYLPFQISQGDGDLVMVYPFAAMNRVIYMKDHTRLPVDSWMGKSSGAWEGDVLVVTTTDQNADTWLDRAGNHHSNQLKVTERFSLIDSSHIHYEATLDDPQTYTRPWTIEMTLYRVIDENAQLLEHKCVPQADGILYEDLIKAKK